jgi:glucan phosphoethanolaminetransferase (alkaline phosphatase superfamily)
VTPKFNQGVLLSFWPLIVLMIILEVALAIIKGAERQWTLKVAIANTVVQIVSLVVFIIIFSNQQVWNDSFSNYVNNLLNITKQMKNWAYQSIILTGIIIISIDIFEGFRKARKSRKTLSNRVFSK